jgi:hypothetical protein
MGVFSQGVGHEGAHARLVTWLKKGAQILTVDDYESSPTAYMPLNKYGCISLENPGFLLRVK